MAALQLIPNDVDGLSFSVVLLLIWNSPNTLNLTIENSSNVLPLMYGENSGFIRESDNLYWQDTEGGRHLVTEYTHNELANLSHHKQSALSSDGNRILVYLKDNAGNVEVGAQVFDQTSNSFIGPAYSFVTEIPVGNLDSMAALQLIPNDVDGLSFSVVLPIWNSPNTLNLTMDPTKFLKMFQR